MTTRPEMSSDPPNLERRPRPTEQVVSQRADESAIVLDLRSGEYFSIEGIGAEIWALCAVDSTVESIIQALESEWAVPRDVLVTDVLEFLDELQRAGLIEYA